MVEKSIIKPKLTKTGAYKFINVTQFFAKKPPLCHSQAIYSSTFLEIN